MKVKMLHSNEKLFRVTQYLKLMLVTLRIYASRKSQNVYFVLINEHINSGAASHCISLSLAKQRSTSATKWVLRPAATACFETQVPGH
jgi:hypothetical protein